MIIITAVKAFEDKVKKLLSEQQVLSYSYNTVIGFRDSSKDAVGSNWYGTEMNKVDSISFFIMVESEKATNVFDAVEALNATCNVQSKVHIAISSIEKHN